MNTLKVGVSPHIRSRVTTSFIMGDVIIALMPALIAATVIFGFRALLLTVISVLTCVISEYVWERAFKMDITIGDLSAVVTGILVAFNVPAGMPIWQLMVGDVAAIIVAKMLFGGIGCNFVNPALVGRVVMMFSFPNEINTYVFPQNGIDALSGATPLGVLSELSGVDRLTLLWGNYAGTIGETCSVALIIGGVYLIVRKVIKPIIPAVFLGGLAFFIWIFGGEAPIWSLFSGGAMLGAFFMATDYVTTPFTNKGKAIFALGCALITAAIRVFGNYSEGTTFAILLMNLVVPYINDLTRTKPMGGAPVK